MALIPSGQVSSSFKPSNCTNGDAPSWQKHYITKQYGNNPEKLEDKKTPTAVCTLQFLIPNDLKPPVLLYYRLTNFYQNHRRYVKSLDTDQLKGKAVPPSIIKGGSCDPLRIDNSTGKPYYPCGLIANSLFNDTFQNPVLKNVRNSNLPKQTYNMTNKGIAWESDKSLYGQTKYNLDDIAVPPNWIERWPSGRYTDDNPPPSLDLDEEFHVWMRSAGLPAFSKLAKRNDHETMACGTYQLEIDLSMPSDSCICGVLTASRLSRYGLRRDKIHHHIHQNRHGGEESFPRYCVRCGQWDLHCSRRFVHGDAPDQAKVCQQSRIVTFGWLTTRQETWRPHIIDME